MCVPDSSIPVLHNRRKPLGDLRGGLWDHTHSPALIVPVGFGFPSVHKDIGNRANESEVDRRGGVIDELLDLQRPVEERS